MKLPDDDHVSQCYVFYNWDGEGGGGAEDPAEYAGWRIVVYDDCNNERRADCDNVFSSTISIIRSSLKSKPGSRHATPDCSICSHATAGSSDAT